MAKQPSDAQTPAEEIAADRTAFGTERVGQPEAQRRGREVEQAPRVRPDREVGGGGGGGPPPR